MALSDVELRLPADPNTPIGSVEVPGAKYAVVEPDATAVAASIISRRAYAEVERFQNRFGENAATASLREWRQEQEPKAVIREPIVELSPREVALRAAQEHVSKAKGTLGICETCAGDIADALRNDVKRLRGLGAKADANEIEARLKKIDVARGRWLKDSRIPAYAKGVRFIDDQDRVVMISKAFSPRVRESFGDDFKIAQLKDVDNISTPVLIELAPSSVSVHVAFRPQSLPASCRTLPEGFGARIVRFTGLACPRMYSLYVAYAHAALLEVGRRKASEPELREALKAWQPRAFTVDAWLVDGSALHFEWFGSPWPDRPDSFRYGDARVAVITHGVVHPLLGDLDYYRRDALEDPTGRPTGLGVMLRLLDEHGY